MKSVRKIGFMLHATVAYNMHCAAGAAVQQAKLKRKRNVYN